MNEEPKNTTPSNIRISIQKLLGHEDIPLPRYMTPEAVGMDIFAAVDREIMIPPGGRSLIPTGFAIALPKGFEAQIRPRSGLAIKHGVTLLNSPGTIDADYRGEIGIIVINHGDVPYVVRRGDRIAQMVVHRVCRVTWAVSENIELTSRGNGGFGHTKI